jgi:hypothetical protein
MDNSVLSHEEIGALEQGVERLVPDDVKIRLVCMARRRFGRHVYPVRSEPSLSGCFRYAFGRYSLWFNDHHNSTRIVSIAIERELIL